MMSLATFEAHFGSCFAAGDIGPLGQPLFLLFIIIVVGCMKTSGICNFGAFNLAILFKMLKLSILSNLQYLFFYLDGSMVCKPRSIKCWPK